MKYFIVIIVILVIILSGCSGNINNSNTESKNDNLVVVNPKEESSIKSSTENKNTQKDKEIKQDDVNIIANNSDLSNYSFYGNWKVDGILATAPIFANTEEDIISIKEVEILYAVDKVSRFDISETLNNPIYKISTLSKNDFEGGERVGFDKLGIEDDMIVKVLVEKEDGYDWEYMGGDFYVKDNSTLILPVNGQFFEMVRVDTIE